MTTLQRFIVNILAGIDRIINAIFGGDPRETISSRMGKSLAAGQCVLCKLICHGLLNPILGKGESGKGHCEDAVDRAVGSQAIIGDAA